jgi:hypothetical protein
MSPEDGGSGADPALATKGNGTFLKALGDQVKKEEVVDPTKQEVVDPTKVKVDVKDDKLVPFDIDGIEVMLPKEQALKLRQKRDELKKKVDVLTTEKQDLTVKTAVTQEEMLKVINDAKAERERNKQEVELYKTKLAKGQIIKDLEAKFISVTGRNPADPTDKILIDHTVASLANKFKYNFENSEVQTLNDKGDILLDSETGSMMSQDKLLVKYLLENEHLVKKNITKGTGATHATNTGKPVSTFLDALKKNVSI